MTQETEDVVASIKEALEDVFYDTLNCGFDAGILAEAALEASGRQSLSDRIDVLEAENRHLRERRLKARRRSRARSRYAKSAALHQEGIDG